jgi:TonB family protein
MYFANKFLITLSMKRTILSLIFLPFFLCQSNAQSSPEEFNSIQKFIESTVQIPFMARIADVQGVVQVRITVGIDSLPMKYEVTQSLRPDCDLEALRVVKLLNIRMLREALNGKKRIIVEVPFFNPKKIFYENNYVLDYYDKDQKPSNNEANIKFVRRYIVDTLTGIIKTNAEYFEYKKKDIVRSGFAFLRIDSSERHYPNFLENQADTLRKFRYLAVTNAVFPNIFFDKYENGQITSKHVGNKNFSYYPNGRIENENELFESDKEKKYIDIHWFANGQLAYVKNTILQKTENLEKYVAVWDTLGKQIVRDGNGFDEYYEGNLKNLTIHSGLLKDGVKEGKWTGKDVNDIIGYTEIYEKGKCLKGESYLGKSTYNYTNPNENAEFKTGMNGFESHLMTNLKYPSAAQRANVSGKVYVQFVVDIDGTLRDFKILKSVGFGCDEESVRVLQLSSGNWKPGKVRGRAFRSRFTIPINYQLSR